MPISPYRVVWLFAMFDLPVDSMENRRQYTRFRKVLLNKGFGMLQYSVYARHLSSEEAADSLKLALRTALPAEGQVRLIAVTDHQFGKMEVYFGKKRTSAEEPPLQISLF